MRRQGLVRAGAAGGEAGLGHLLGRGRGLPRASGARSPPRTLPRSPWPAVGAGPGRAGREAAFPRPRRSSSAAAAPQPNAACACPSPRWARAADAGAAEDRDSRDGAW